jgi:hypothetical protein
VPLADSVARSPKYQNLQMSSKVPMTEKHIAIATMRKIIRIKERIHSASHIPGLRFSWRKEARRGGVEKRGGKGAATQEAGGIAEAQASVYLIARREKELKYV